MGLLKNSIVYLAGPVEHSGDATTWRDDFSAFLDPKGVRIFNPMKPPDWTSYTKHPPRAIHKAMMGQESSLSREKAFEVQREILTVCKRMVAAADWVICRMPRVFTVGTIDELAIAKYCGKPVMFWVDKTIPSSWAVYFTCDTVDDLKEYFSYSAEELKAKIVAIDNGEISLDPLKWMFIPGRTK
jgi:nucleoside 2-deoxyribosyltransferase